MVLGDRNICAAISGNDRWVASSGRRRSSAPVRADAPRVVETVLFCQPGPRRLGLARQVSGAGPPELRSAGPPSPALYLTCAGASGVWLAPRSKSGRSAQDA